MEQQSSPTCRHCRSSAIWEGSKSSYFQGVPRWAAECNPLHTTFAPISLGPKLVSCRALKLTVFIQTTHKCPENRRADISRRTCRNGCRGEPRGQVTWSPRLRQVERSLSLRALPLRLSTEETTNWKTHSESIFAFCCSVCGSDCFTLSEPQMSLRLCKSFWENRGVSFLFCMWGVEGSSYVWDVAHLNLSNASQVNSL